MTLTSYFCRASSSAPPHPHPTSSSVMPGSSASLPSARSNFATWASSVLMSSRSKGNRTCSPLSDPETAQKNRRRRRRSIAIARKTVSNQRLQQTSASYPSKSEVGQLNNDAQGGSRHRCQSPDHSETCTEHTNRRRLAISTGYGHHRRPDLANGGA